MPRGRPRKQAGPTQQGPEAPTSAQANGAGISKLEAVRRSLAELGDDARPLVLQDHLRKTYGIDMEASYISKYKSLVLTSARKGKRKAYKPRAAAAPEAAAPAARTAGPTGGISLDDLRSLKELSDRLGAEKVGELVDLVTR